MINSSGRNDKEGVWSLYVIDTSKLNGTYHFFKLNDLIEEFVLKILDRAGRHIRRTFLCAQRLLIEAIVEERNPGEVGGGKFLYTTHKVSILIDNKSKRKT